VKGLIGRQAALLPIAAMFIVPTYMVLVNSFKTKVDILRAPLDIPFDRLTTANFAAVLNQTSAPIGGAYVFSTALALTSALGVVILGSSLSYVVARMRGPWANRLFIFLFLGLIIPPQVVVIPVVKVLLAIGLLHALPGLILYEIALQIPFATFVYVGFIRAVPRDLEEAAQIDGANKIQTFVRVVFPILTPATASLFVLVLIFVWNDFVNPQLVLGPTGGTTITTGIYRAIGVYQQDWGAIYANIVLASAPMIVVYFAMQRYIVGGLTGGAIKG
jgi:raffinose/stachyose/melibiose transport system permease protein